MNAIRDKFIQILFFALLSSGAGGAFGYVVCLISPELIQFFCFTKIADPLRYGAALGMVLGLLIGAAVATTLHFCATLLEAVREWRRPAPEFVGAPSGK